MNAEFAVVHVFLAMLYILYEQQLLVALYCYHISQSTQRTRFKTQIREHAYVNQIQAQIREHTHENILN
jgi:Ni,Fe-hydrogenase I cytochrome b subunit